MSDTPFLGELRLMSFAFPPRGWALCNGQTLQINQNQALYALLGVTYGGNAQTTFNLPDLRGRVPIHVGDGVFRGQAMGAEFHTLTIGELPEHTHAMRASAAPANQSTPGLLAAAANLYREGSPTTALHPATISGRGGTLPHENRQPYLTLNWCIALAGIFPSQN
ncbi:microcystin-dependent protein [Conexibacter arvalis]|uniref:Microcystin-dependent protein n=2 Tax=Conexibacter arvalis TaxID=912552 RepID=A0A840IHS5_9ACTN|nr:tail fiber protein [Conexibacter arvalis]MBB4663771.1 microcystin-dependent protein [Conexibacter arvalis]